MPDDVNSILMHYLPSEPTEASEGNLWYNNEEGKLYRLCDGHWVEVQHNTSTVRTERVERIEGYTDEIRVDRETRWTNNFTPPTVSYPTDGASDYLPAPNSEDWDFGSGDFTIDFTVYLSSPNPERCSLEDEFFNRTCSLAEEFFNRGD